jgi:hypothetical protein
MPTRHTGALSLQRAVSAPAMTVGCDWADTWWCARVWVHGAQHAAGVRRAHALRAVAPAARRTFRALARAHEQAHARAHRELHRAQLRQPVAVGVLGEVERHRGAVRGAALPEGRLERELRLVVSQVAFGFGAAHVWLGTTACMHDGAHARLRATHARARERRVMPRRHTRHAWGRGPTGVVRGGGGVEGPRVGGGARQRASVATGARAAGGPRVVVGCGVAGAVERGQGAGGKRAKQRGTSEVGETGRVKGGSGWAGRHSPPHSLGLRVC